MGILGNACSSILLIKLAKLFWMHKYTFNLKVPFAAFVKKYLHGNYGNMAVWVSLIIGQPASIMMYIHGYYIDYFRNSN